MSDDISNEDLLKAVNKILTPLNGLPSHHVMSIVSTALGRVCLGVTEDTRDAKLLFLDVFVKGMLQLDVFERDEEGDR